MTDDQAGLLIHVSSGTKNDLDTALRYAVNFAAAAAAAADDDDVRPVDVVVNGAALDLVLAGSDFHHQVTELADGGIIGFSACANTMTARGVHAADLHPAARIVTAAVVHLAQRQWAGWAYLRP